MRFTAEPSAEPSAAEPSAALADAAFVASPAENDL